MIFFLNFILGYKGTHLMFLFDFRLKKNLQALNFKFLLILIRKIKKILILFSETQMMIVSS